MFSDLDDLCRLLMALVFFPTAAIGLFHRLKAETGEKLDRKQEGMALLIPIRVLGLSAFLMIGVWLVSPSMLRWAQIDLPAWGRISGFGSGLLLIGWYWWVFHGIGRNITDTVVTRKEHELVTHGPYRWVRHPLYTGLIPFGLAVALLMANWLIAAVMAGLFILLRIRTDKEEANLIARFGDSYRRYMETTGRFLPKL